MEISVDSKKAVKWNVRLKSKMAMPSKYREKPIEMPVFFTAGPYTSTKTTDLRDEIDTVFEVLEEKMSDFALTGSGWTLERNNDLILKWQIINPFMARLTYRYTLI